MKSPNSLGYLMQGQVHAVQNTSPCLYGPYISVYYCNIYSGFLPRGILHPEIRIESCVISTAQSL